MTPQQQVFDNLLLRHLILTKVEYMKYKSKLYFQIKELVLDNIKGNWYKFCSCELCQSDRERLTA